MRCFTRSTIAQGKKFLPATIIGGGYGDLLATFVGWDPKVWTEQDQWEPLWEDIFALADRYYQAGSYCPHFMGAVVLEQLNTAAGTLDLCQ